MPKFKIEDHEKRMREILRGANQPPAKVVGNQLLEQLKAKAQQGKPPQIR